MTNALRSTGRPHVAMITQPDEVTDLILRAGTATAGQTLQPA